MCFEDNSKKKLKEVNHLQNKDPKQIEVMPACCLEHKRKACVLKVK